MQHSWCMNVLWLSANGLRARECVANNWMAVAHIRAFPAPYLIKQIKMEAATLSSPSIDGFAMLSIAVLLTLEWQMLATNFESFSY